MVYTVLWMRIALRGWSEWAISQKCQKRLEKHPSLGYGIAQVIDSKGLSTV